MKNSNEIRVAENHYDIDLSTLFGEFSLTKQVHKDGTVCFEISYLKVDENTGSVVPCNETIWPRCETLADEMLKAPMRPADAYVRIGWFAQEDGSLKYSMKYIEVYGDKEHKQAFAPLGEKRVFAGSEPVENNEEGE